MSITRIPNTLDNVVPATTSAAGIAQFATSGESAALKSVQGNDARLSDTRTPAAHKLSHESGGSDALTLNLDANARTDVAKDGSTVGKRRRINIITGTNTTLAVTDDSDNEKVDVTVAVPDASTSTKGAVQLATTSSDVTVGHAVQANDARLSDARTPSAHKISHETGGSDALTGSIDGNARVNVQNAGTSVGTRRAINFITGAPLTKSIADISASERVNVTFGVSAATTAATGVVKSSFLYSSLQDDVVTNTLIDTGIGNQLMNGSDAIAGGTFTAGRSIRLRAYGYYQVNGTGESFTVHVYLGGTTVVSILVDNLSAAAGTDLYFDLDVLITCRTIGSSGTFIGQGKFIHTQDGTGATDVPAVGVAINTSTVTVNTTVSQSLDVGIQWTNLSVHNILTCTNLVAEFVG